jgi:hypothetical protein
VKASLKIDTGKFGASYTDALLRRLCRISGINIISDNDADVFFVSMCDPSDLHVLIDARKLAGDRLVIVGGFESYFATPLMAWADYAVVGEGFDFFNAIKNSKDWKSLSCVLQKGGKAEASYNTEWNLLPIVKTGKKKMYYLAGRGCHNKCLFCATSWVQPFRQQSVDNLKIAARQAQKAKCGMTFICNDSRGIPRFKNVNAASVTIRDYLRNPKEYKSLMLHFGVEGWTEAERVAYGKPVSDDDIAHLFAVTSEEKQRCELFTIVGRSDWSLDCVRDFANRIPQDTNHLPPVFLKATYFDPCPHTPLARECPATEYADIEKMFRILNSRNKRIRVFPVRSLARSNWRTVLHRCCPEQAMRLGGEPSDVNHSTSRAVFLEKLRGLKLDHLAFAVEFQPCENIKTRIK